MKVPAHDWVIMCADGSEDIYGCVKCGASGGAVDGHSFDPYYDGEAVSAARVYTPMPYVVTSTGVRPVSENCEVAAEQIRLLTG